MKVYHYNALIQKAIGAKANVEPWLHIVFREVGNEVFYAIYVWDTRKVVEEGKFRGQIRSLTVFGPKTLVPAWDKQTKLDGATSKQIQDLFD